MPPQKMTAEERRIAMNDQRRVRMANVASLVIDLHDNDFRSLLIESHQVDDHFYQRIVIERNELPPDMIKTLLEIAEVHDATVQLIRLHWDQVEHARLAVWPSRD